MITIKSQYRSLLAVCVLFCLSCNNNSIVSPDSDYHSDNSYSLDGPHQFSSRPRITIKPIDAFQSYFICDTSFRDKGKTYIRIDWPIKNRNLNFAVSSVKDKEKELADDFERNGHMMFSVDETEFCCMAGITEPIKIYADQDIDEYISGENLSSLFTILCMHDDKVLANAPYPEMTPINVWRGYYSGPGIFIPVSEYFAIGTSPLLYICHNALITTIDGYDHLLDGSLTLHFELPVIGINSKGEEESIVLKGDLNSKS